MRHDWILGLLACSPLACAGSHDKLTAEVEQLRLDIQGMRAEQADQARRLSELELNQRTGSSFSSEDAPPRNSYNSSNPPENISSTLGKRGLPVLVLAPQDSGAENSEDEDESDGSDGTQQKKAAHQNVDPSEEGSEHYTISGAGEQITQKKSAPPPKSTPSPQPIKSAPSAPQPTKSP